MYEECSKQDAIPGSIEHYIIGIHIAVAQGNE